MSLSVSAAERSRATGPDAGACRSTPDTSVACAPSGARRRSGARSRRRTWTRRRPRPPDEARARTGGGALEAEQPGERAREASPERPRPRRRSTLATARAAASFAASFRRLLSSESDDCRCASSCAADGRNGEAILHLLCFGDDRPPCDWSGLDSRLWSMGGNRRGQYLCGATGIAMSFSRQAEKIRIQPCKDRRETAIQIDNATAQMLETSETMPTGNPLPQQKPRSNRIALVGGAYSAHR